MEALPGAKIDGCSFTLKTTPVIAVSGRGKRLDKVLWTLLHEIAHVLLDHVSSEIIVESLDDSDYINENEFKADTQAGNWLLPTPLPPIPLRIGADWVTRVAADRGLAPIALVGHLQKRKILDWRST